MAEVLIFGLLNVVVGWHFEVYKEYKLGGSDNVSEAELWDRNMRLYKSGEVFFFSMRIIIDMTK